MTKRVFSNYVFHLLLPIFASYPSGVFAEDPPMDFVVESPTHGTKFRLEEARGKIVVLHFLLKTECPFCLQHTQKFWSKSKENQDVVHLFIKPDSDAEIKKWAEHLDMKKKKDDRPPIYRDPDAKLAKAFQIPDGYAFHGLIVHFPALVALGPDGAELFRYVGKNNSDRMSFADFEKRLRETTETKK